MLYSYLLTTFLGAAYAGTGPFEKGDLDRYVTFYSSDDCSYDKEDPSGWSIPMSMHRSECVREASRKSMMPGEEFAKHGEFCHVWFNDDCDCIAGSRRIHTVWEPYHVMCETEEVAGHTARFMPAWWNGGDWECPSKGCYADGKDSIVWEVRKQHDAQEGQDPTYYFSNGTKRTSDDDQA